MKSRPLIDLLHLTEDQIFEMSNLDSSITGLPYEIWISPKTTNHNAMRLKVLAGGSMASVLFDKKGNILRVVTKDKKYFNNANIKPVATYLKNNAGILTKFWNKEINIAAYLQYQVT